MIFGSQPFSLRKVGLPPLMLMKHDIHAAFQQQRDHEVRAEASISQEHIARPKCLFTD
jgi:hypothetical protein